MNQETKQCQNCRQNFTIEPEDFAFYEKIKVPAPTWCPECRMVRRMLWRNERSLHKRKCDAPGHNEEIISIYHKNSPFKVYDQKYWWSDEWDAMNYGRDYDFNKAFFEQWRKLLKEVPAVNLENEMPSTLINSEYCNDSWESLNCYLCVTAGMSENCTYSNIVVSAKDILDSTWTIRSERCYQCIDSYNSYNIFFSQNVDQCIDSYFLFDCRNCQNCFGCVGLRNKQYHIFNKSYTKEEYKKKLEEFDLGNYKTIFENKEQFKKFKLSSPHKYALLTNCQNVIGNNVRNSKNCFNCFDIEGGIENGKNIVYAGLGLKDCYDVFNSGTNSELFYDAISVGMNSNNIKFSNNVFYNSFSIYYSRYCRNSSNLFACIGLRSKQYCILNKQYTKEEYEKLVLKIIQHMNDMPYIDKKGRAYKYGEFFPPELSPFAYNETIAQEYFPLSAEAAAKAGFNWKQPEVRNIQITVKSEDIPDHIKDVKDDIIGKVIQCQHAQLTTNNQQLTTICNEQCTQAFKIIEPELAFYRKMNLPLPRLCPNCRHYQRLKQRNPLKLWHRKCNCHGIFGVSEKGIMNNELGIKYQNTIKHFHGDNPCPNEFETTYAPERPEIVYCEKCYQAEVV